MDHFPLLSLPRELRDYAYAFMVTCPEVVIHATELKNGKEATSEAFPSDEDHNLATRRYNRSTFESTMEDRTRTYTYSMEPDAMGTIITKDFFNVFLTNRQVYKEASAMFYSKNEFSFMGVEQRKANPTQEDMSIPAALAFFRDTQPKTLRKISRIGPRVRKLTSDSSTPKDSHGHKLAPIEDGWSDDELEDYASSDGGSNDSLIDLSGRIPSAQTVPVDDQEYFNLFERDALEV
ncbi:hypothetical protein GTA08_BOTSDO06206 [Botryosphaeria dothidea]|uniref:Uncharacterized protein n=1 Tax=Botryosphaeria dothidea TaxID=55169 RepID=A0A8H4ISS9_9PEZI|nr:hypothetical protein GTA08_BOTSDO10293 [Botryosphaeria dothidea]KAF4305704.1 hypothetical protein GTA08_BOTSDO06206 [Botryosphaeria dothidea]